MASADPDALTAFIRVGNGLRTPHDISSVSTEQWLERVTQIISKKEEAFYQLRGNLLVALCSALEHAVKAFCADGLINRPGTQNDWSTMRGRYDSKSDDIWKVTDDLFSETARRTPMANRMTEFILSKCSVPVGRSFSQHSFDTKILNNAYRGRNIFVHTGYHVSTTSPTLNAELLYEYVKSMRDFIESLRSASEQLTFNDF